MNKKTGFTLIELLVVLAIISILAILAAPNYSRMLAKNEMQASLSDWRSAFYLAQKEAIRLKHRVELCPSEDGLTCTADRFDYSKGWIVRDNTANSLIQDFPPKDRNGMSFEMKLDNANTNDGLNFLHNGRLPPDFIGPAGVDLTLKHKKYNDVTIAVNISRAGRIKNSK